MNNIPARTAAALIAALALIALFVYTRWGSHDRPQSSLPSPLQNSVASLESREPSTTTGGSESPAANTTEEGRRKSLSPEEHAQIVAEIESVRAMLAQIESANSEVLFESANSKNMRLHAPTEQQLDSVYTALTKSADAFPPTSPASDIFREEALALIREFGTYKSGGRLIGFNAKDPSGVDHVRLFECEESGAELKVNEAGGLEITSEEMSYRPLPDWDKLDSPARRRYGHLFSVP